MQDNHLDVDKIKEELVPKSSKLVIFTESFNELVALNFISLILKKKVEFNLWGVKVKSSYFLGELSNGEYITILIHNGMVWCGKSDHYLRAKNDIKPIGKFNSLNSDIFELANNLKWTLPNDYIELG